MRIGVTGANGFIGRALCDRWGDRADIVPIVRNSSNSEGAVGVGDLNAATDWSSAVAGLDVIVHCAGRAHILRDLSHNPLQAFREVNRDATIRLAETAASAGVRRLVFISSVGVMGPPKGNDGLLRPSDCPAPEKPYAISKWEAEEALRRIEASSALEVVIVRPPLVYGPGAPANFQRFMKLISKGVPLPIGAVNAVRSFVGIENLSDFLWLCATTPSARGRTYFVSDGEDISTAEFGRRIARGMGRPVRFLPVPTVLLRLFGSFVGREADVDRLLSNVRVDITANEMQLGWRPQHSVGSQIDLLVRSGVIAK